MKTVVAYSVVVYGLKVKVFSNGEGGIASIVADGQVSRKLAVVLAC